jgi:hypothetical protein
VSHAVFSPSSSARWLRCPGSAVLSYGLTRIRRDTVAAMLGTRAHLVAERTLKHQPLPECGTAEARLAAPFVDHVKALARSRKGRVHVFAEERIGIAPDCWGTADAVIYAPDEGVLDILDLKTGRHPVSPDAAQIRLYAGGAMRGFPASRQINGWVVQPRVYDGPQCSTYEPWELTGLLQLAKESIDKAKEDPKRHLKTGDWCRYCPAQSICPAVATELVNLIPSGNLDDDPDYAADFD